MPTNSFKTITDKYGYQWKQETTNGYRRVCDGFFIPNFERYQHEYHSVESQRAINLQIKKQCEQDRITGKTTVTEGVLFG